MRAAGTPQVLVVGAGPVGLALACHLRRLDMAVRLVEKRPGPSVHSKAIGLQHRVSEVLARLGIVERFIERGGSPTVINLYEGERRILRLRFETPGRVSGRGAFAPRPILLPQSETEELLAGLFAELGGEIEWRTELLEHRQEADRVVSRLRLPGGEEREVKSRWLVSCEGAHSVVRQGEGISFGGKTYPLAFAMADLVLETDLDHDENHVWLHREGSFAALPLPPPRTWRLFAEVTGEGGELRQGVTLEAMSRLMARRTGSEARVTGPPLWLSEFRINCRMVGRMRSGRAFLAGDAAHIHSPTGGQGITTGMQDAANLAWKLARVAAGAPDALLDTYGEERLPHAAEVLAETDRTTTILFAPTPAWRLLRDLVVLPVLRSRVAQRMMFGKFSQLHVHYRGSSLSQERIEGWRRPRVRAGDRAPDIAFRHGGSGAETTLFGLLRRQRPVVLLGQPAAAERLCRALEDLEVEGYVVTGGPAAEGTGPGGGAERRLVDVHGELRRLYGLGGEDLCLVRPDGHVGLLQRPLDPGHLAAYLARICPPGAVARAFPSAGC